MLRKQISQVPWWVWLILSVIFLAIVILMIVFLLLWLRKKASCSQACTFNIQDVFSSLGGNCFQPVNENVIPIQKVCVEILNESTDPSVKFTVQPFNIILTSPSYSTLPSDENSPTVVSVHSAQIGWFQRTDENGSKIIGLRDMTDITNTQRFCLNTTNKTVSITGPLETQTYSLDS